jgi:uncharacterized protein (TIGR02391 family)
VLTNWLTPEQVIRTPVDRLGILILHALQQVDESWAGAHNFSINYLAQVRSPHFAGGPTVRTGEQILASDGPTASRLHEAWAWLDREGYVMPVPGKPNEQWRQLTQKGRDALTAAPDDALRKVRAGEVLGRHLHPHIEALVRRDWNDGDFETAIFKATREVEIAVRDALGDDATGLVGVKLMNKAFGAGGKLLDREQDPGEQDGTRALYAGVIGVFKNPGSHRHFAPDDPVQAAEIISTADLLFRMLQDRLGQA